MIRTFTSSDLRSILAIFDRLSPEFFHPNEKVDLERYLGFEIEDYFVWEENGIILASGGINYFPEIKEARISWDLVCPEYQRKGLGMKLMIYRLNQIQRKGGFQNVVVRTSQMAWRFYEKNGFILKEVQNDFWATGYDLYQMTKEVN
jgi:[ribosomal protein S18]-alanine N-acetyltransferase